MRQFILPAVLATAAITGLATPSVAQQPFCIAGRGCVPMTPASYNACFNLALARGLSLRSCFRIERYRGVARLRQGFGALLRLRSFRVSHA